VRRLLISTLIVVLVGALAYPAPAQPGATLATPDLIERAVARGDISRAQADRYLAYAIGAPDKLPARFRSDVPWDATLAALRLTRTPARRAAVRDALGLAGPGLGRCFISNAPMPDTLETDHFYIEYNALTLRGGLTIADYAASLEHTWATEVTSFGWAAPPVLTSSPPPGNKYHVRIDELSPVIYGFVSNDGTHAGLVGNNPSTSWNDGDADASCMVLNADFDQFPGTAQQALDATTAHEFNHSIQFGYGALSGANTPDDVFVEGGATWMEDEVFDGANDNYNYLWPVFENDMGEYEDSPYPYWITFRGLTERFGTGTSGGGENVMQRFWELTSQNRASNLQALNLALKPFRTNLADGYHAYAIAAKFNRACGGGYVLPHCFQEGPAYVEAAGVTEPHGAIDAVGGSFEGSLPDNYSLNWVLLPTVSGSYRVTVVNAAAGGVLRATVVCDTGTELRLQAIRRVIAAGRSGTVASVNPADCEQVVAVVTNQAQTAANPDTSEDRLFRVLTSTAS
jgi:hypothetical protein